jgi:peptidoglycan-associated lipoprotein
MIRKGWMLVVLGVAVCALATTGCKKKPKAGSTGMDGIDPVGGLNGTDPYAAESLADRPGGLVEQASQFGVVYFDFDSAQVNPGERSKLEAVAEFLRTSTTVGLVVEGHCDERGSNEYNLALGERRALAIRAYLVGLGVDASRMQTKSLGEEQPVALGHDEASWGQNRRAAFGLFQQ